MEFRCLILKIKIMKNLFFALCFMLVGTFAFASNIENDVDLYQKNKAVVLPNLNYNDIMVFVNDFTIEKSFTYNDNVDFEGTACCTITDGHNQSAFCDEKGNDRRACRKARRKFGNEEFDNSLF